MANVDRLLSKRGINITSETNFVRDLLMDKYDISLAGGYPFEKKLPIRQLMKIGDDLVEKYGPGIAQYEKTPAQSTYAEAVLMLGERRGIHAENKNVAVTPGSQAALDYIAQLYLNEGDIVAVEAPTYLAAISAFRRSSPRFIQIRSDQNGPNLADFQAALDGGAKLIYTVNPFANPGGGTIPPENIQAIAEMLALRNSGYIKTLLVEDGAYSDMTFTGQQPKSLYQSSPDSVVHLGTFSKIGVPTFRLGFVIASQEIIDHFTKTEQSAILLVSGFLQKIMAEFVLSGQMDKHVEELIATYRPKLDLMYELVRNLFPSQTVLTKPNGGFFLFPQNFGANAINVLQQTKKTSPSVSFVPGAPFYVDPLGHEDTMRLNFTNASVDEIPIAVNTVARAVKEESQG